MSEKRKINWESSNVLKRHDDVFGDYITVLKGTSSSNLILTCITLITAAVVFFVSYNMDHLLVGYGIALLFLGLGLTLLSTCFKQLEVYEYGFKIGGDKKKWILYDQLDTIRERTLKSTIGPNTQLFEIFYDNSSKPLQIEINSFIQLKVFIKDIKEQFSL